MPVYDRIFDAVFPPASEVEIPTPCATPLLDTTAQFAAFPQSAPPSSCSGGAEEQIKWDRSWHIATSFLALADEPIDIALDSSVLKEIWVKPYNAEIHNALKYVTLDESRRRTHKGQRDEDLLRWYLEDVVASHYSKHVLPELKKVKFLMQHRDAG